ncbi:MAG: hypothetical protein Q9183_006804 [Haloplaca sp. 2 TL-2023]
MPRRMPPPPPPMLSAESSTEAAAPAPEPVFSPAARNIMRYFSEHWDEQGMRDLCSWIDDESRVDAADFVRRCTETDVRAYNGGDEHPNHGREFDSRNLWCAQHQGRCALCDAVCCVYKEAMQAYHEAPTEQCRVLAKQAGALIQRASDFEEEESTFLPCAECQQLVCPGPARPSRGSLALPTMFFEEEKAGGAGEKAWMVIRGTQIVENPHE